MTVGVGSNTEICVETWVGSGFAGGEARLPQLLSNNATDKSSERNLDKLAIFILDL